MSEALNATNTKSISRVKSVAVCLAAYLAAVVVAIVTGYMLQGYHPILIAGAADLAATVVILAFSVYYGNASI
jgi:putative NIF3 family GTP cyclohydrolase 1 type 2